MYDMPEREPDTDLSLERPKTGQCSLCEAWRGGRPTGWMYTEKLQLVSTGRPGTDQVHALVGGVTFCSCTLGRWMRAKQAERQAERKRA